MSTGAVAIHTRRQKKDTDEKDKERKPSRPKRIIRGLFHRGKEGSGENEPGEGGESMGEQSQQQANDHSPNQDDGVTGGTINESRDRSGLETQDSAVQPSPQSGKDREKVPEDSVQK